MNLPLIPKDKANHFAYFSFGVWILMLIGMPSLYIIAIVVILGAAKELIHDKLMGRGNCEWGDMLANVLPLLWLLTGWASC